MARGRPLPPLEVSDEVRRVLEGYARRRKTSQQLALRARIVLRCADGESNMMVAHQLDTTRAKPWAGGGRGFWRRESTGFTMSRGRAPRERSMMRESKRS